MDRFMPDRARLVFSRYSCRRFTTDPVPAEDRALLREALRWAPSAGNAQPWRFYEVLRPEAKRALAAAALNQAFVAQAPVVYAVCADPGRAEKAYGERGRDLYVFQDTAAAVMNLLLAATDLGYGTCWVGAFHEGQAARVLGCGPGLRPVALVPLGRPAEPDPGSTRRPLREVLRVVE